MEDKVKNSKKIIARDYGEIIQHKNWLLEQDEKKERNQIHKLTVQIKGMKDLER